MNRKFISLITAFAIIFISSVVALADSPDDVRASSVSTPVGYYDVDHFNLSLRTGLTSSGLTRDITYTISDLYDLTYDINYGAYTGSSYAPVRMAGYLGNWNSNILNLQNWLTVNESGTRVGIGTYISNMTQDLTDIKNYNSNMSGKLSNLDTSVSSINSKLPSYNWVHFPSSYIGGKSDPNASSFLSSTSYGSNFYLYYSIERNYSLYPIVLRIFVPLYATSNSYSGRPPFGNVTFSYSDGTVARLDDFDYFVEGSEGGSYIYVFDFNQRSTGTFVVHVSSSVSLVFRSDVSGNISYISFNSDEYQQLKQAFYQQKSANSLGSLDKLADVYASDDLIQAKQAQQSVEDGVLTDFTGQGSESMSLSDVGGVKNVSSNAKQFLGTGSSGSNALSVFNVNGQGLWQWFSQTTSNNLDTTTPTRGLDGYLTIYDQNMQNYLDGLGGDENAR